MMKTVVTMTCWTKRINQMPIFLDYFFSTQTKKPDLFYLWLATEEFPDHILPLELVVAIQKYGVILKWIEKNEYCHKRWRVYPEHYEDVVISLDEDKRYTNDLVEQAVNCKTITNLYIPRFEKPVENVELGICGQCIIPPKTFPLEAYNEKYLNDRLEYSPKCDMSLCLPLNYEFDCASGESALYRDIGDKKAVILSKLVQNMVTKYDFDIDKNRLNGILNYMNIQSV